MIDIAEKLFPNLLTLLAQLDATGTIYLLYRKYLHQPAMNYLDNQAEELNEAQNYAKTVEEEAQAKTQAFDTEHQAEDERVERAQQAMGGEARKENEKIIEQATNETELMPEQAQNEIEIQRANLIAEVEDYLLDVALNLTERTLENYDYDETEIYHSLEVELEQMNNETH